jgi:hypothetical protein
MIPWLLALWVSAFSVNHEFYLGVFYLEANEGQQQLELTAKLFTDDLENALSQRFGQPVFLDQSDTLSPYITQYLNERFLLRSNGHIHIWQWVGMETDPDLTYVYLSAKLPSLNAPLTTEVTVFFELFKTQTNIVHLKYNEIKKSAYLTPGKPSYTFKL